MLAGLPAPAPAATEQEVEAASVRILSIAPTTSSTDAQGRKVTTRSAERGSGFVLNDQGDVVTNQHVIDGAESIWVGHREDGRVILYAVDMKTVWSSKNQDLAVVHCPELHQKPMTLTFFEPAKGSDVYTIGYPGIADDATAIAAVKILLKDVGDQKKLDVTDILKKEPSLANFFDASVRHGEVTRLSTHPSFDDPNVTIQLIDNTVVTGHGGSGGPLLNQGGEVLGVVGKSRLRAASEHDIDRVYWAISCAELKQHLDSAHVAYTAAKEPFKAKTIAGPVAPTPPVEPVKPPKDEAPKPVAPVTDGAAATFPILGAVGIAFAVLLAGGSLAVGLLRGRKVAGASTGVTALVDEKVQRKMDAMMDRLHQQPSPSAGQRTSQVSPPAPANAAGWILKGTDAQGRPVRLEIPETLLAGHRDGLFIGRNSGQSQLVISDNSISKQHAQIRRAGGALVVVDRQSANGTAVNGRFGKPNEEMPLRAGDTLTLGEVKLLLAESSNVSSPPTLT
jgi:hypothetical protein